MSVAITKEKREKVMRKVRPRPAVLILLAFVLLAPTTLAPMLNVAHADTIPCGSSNTVLLIQDSPPRMPAQNHDPNGADVNELEARNMPFCMITSDQLASTDLSQFSEIIIASTQNQAFYDNLFPGGAIDPNISNWVQDGGVLSANLADCAGGSWSFTACASDSSSSYAFLGGVTHVVSFSDDNNINTQSHPIITGQFGGANGGQIVDNSCLQDLDCWQRSSHGYFTNLSADTTIILTDDSNGPVFIEYHYGDGLVIASTTSSEWRYDYFQQNFQNLKLLANEIGYQAFKAQCQENDGDGEFDGNHGHGNFHHDSDQCEEGNPDPVWSTDRGDGRDFQSTSIQSTQLDKITRTVTIIGLGTSGGLPISFTYIAIEPGLTTPGWVSFAFSDGFTNAGPMTSGSIVLHGW